VSDGAICFACIETNPEVLLVLEAQRRPGAAAAWYCGFNRAAFAGLHVRLDGKEIWTAPNLGGTSPNEPYHVVPISLRR
jgi:hypothetical protein